MNRFKAASPTRRFPWSTVLSLAFFVCIIAVFLLAVSSMSKNAEEEQKNSLDTALRRGITQCYAMEGRYPESLDYLKEHYNVAYDEDAFFVAYQPTAANLPPVITILSKGGMPE